MMFVDLVGSTGLAARLDPEDLKDVIAKFQRAVADEVRRFGGHVAKPLGDGLLIYFGWPRAHEDDAERAARSAIAIVAAVRQLASQMEPRWPGFQTRDSRAEKWEKLAAAIPTQSPRSAS